MTPYKLRDKDCKNYPHFDAPISRRILQRLVNDSAAVARHAFLPFLVYTKARNSLKSRTAGKAKKSPRPIRYAARQDAAIFAAYRSKLSELYEQELISRNIAQCVIAYRRIKKSSKRGNKCNIEFAKDAFDAIAEYDNCTVFAFDISSYFESIDHEILKSQWCKLLGVERLPPDHFAVFKAITHYSFAMKKDVYARLGFLHPKALRKILKKTYTVRKKDMPKQLCSPDDFKLKIAGKGGSYDKLIKTNTSGFGIPQGSPISDVLANLYLLDFDADMHTHVKSLGGMYYRYSDDILLILPRSDVDINSVSAFVGSSLKKSGSNLEISCSKTNIVAFERDGDHHVFTAREGSSSKEGLEYLGFRFDGKNVYLRNATMSNLHRKIAKKCKKLAENHIARHAGKDIHWLEHNFDFTKIEKAFGRVPDFEPFSKKSDWTFWTYAKKSLLCFDVQGKPIAQQLRKQKAFIRKFFLRQLRKSY